jgi:very-short-patch-repair endonuclease
MDHSGDTPLARIALIAGRQHRIVTLEQLRAAGFSATMIKTACQRGLLTRVGPGVYALGAPLSLPDERALAAVLAARPTGLLSHHWCRWLFRVGRLPRHDPDVTVTGNRELGGVTIHRTRNPPTPDSNRGIPCTRPERMVIDCAPDLTGKDLRRLVNDVQIKRLAGVEALRTAAKDHPGRATGRVAALVADDHGATRSLLEDLLLDLHRDHGLPKPAVNAVVEGVEVDFSYPGLVIEADGYRYHGATKIAFENDRARWLHLESRGQRVIAVSYRQVTEDRERTAGQLLAVIGDRG